MSQFKTKTFSDKFAYLGGTKTAVKWALWADARELNTAHPFHCGHCRGEEAEELMKSPHD